MSTITHNTMKLVSTEFPSNNGWFFNFYSGVLWTNSIYNLSTKSLLNNWSSISKNSSTHHSSREKWHNIILENYYRKITFPWKSWRSGQGYYPHQDPKSARGKNRKEKGKFILTWEIVHLCRVPIAKRLQRKKWRCKFKFENNMVVRQL